MGRGMGRGAKAVGVITHQGTSGRKNKAPKGLRGSKRHKLASRAMRHAKGEESQGNFSNAAAHTKERAVEELVKHQMPFPMMAKTTKMKYMVRALKTQRAASKKKKVAMK